MPLTLDQFLLLLIAIGLIIGITLLVNTTRRLRKTAQEAEEAIAEFRKLVGEARETNRSIQAKAEDVGELVRATKKTAMSAAEITGFVATKILRPSSKYWPFLFPLIRLGWRYVKKRKEGKNV